MPRITQFKAALYSLILLGMVGYGLASGSPVMWLLGCGGVVVNVWLVRTGRFKPLPRWIANVLTLLTMVYVGHDVRISAGSNTTVLVIGQFLVVLQLVKLWEQRGNRDFGQLLVLSLLLMVASAINTSNLFFGILFAGYLFLSLYCCLLFHLKVETDAARAASVTADEKVNPATLRQDEHHLSRSMRRLTGIMASFALTTAVIIFLLFPRGTGQSMLVPAQLQAQYVLTGFTDEVRFDQVARITQNDSIVAYAEVWKKDGDGDESRVTGGVPLLLRGVTLDAYHSSGPKGGWTRNSRDDAVDASEPDGLPWKSSNQPERGATVWRQKILLHPTGTRPLFALAGAFKLAPHRELRLRHGDDGALQSEDPVNSQTDYDVWSTGELDDQPSTRAPRPDRIAPAIAAYARRADVSGADAAGPLAARRPTDADNIGSPHELDAQIAENIAAHLRGPAFSYTLDITDAKTRHNTDPYVWFLSADGHRGHCEYFAGAMVLMCQSLGMDARMVVGFRCDEYNNTPGAGYYIVRQSHAHAWVEVRTTKGWRVFDPTSGREGAAGASHGRLGKLWKSVQHFFDFLEYSYAEKVVAYDNQNRQNLLEAVETRMASTATGSSSGLRNLIRRWNEWWEESNLSETVAKLGGPVLVTLIGLGTLLAAALAARWLWRQIQLRRRAARIGIESLPPAEQLRLARQLGFYDDLVRLLGRHQITRPPHLTPMEFSAGLGFLPDELHATVRRLTAVYYRVRYGRADLSSAQQKHLANVITRVDAGLEQAIPKA